MKLEKEFNNRLNKIERGRPSSFSAGVIGVGDLGRHVVRALVELRNQGIGLEGISISDINITESYLKASVLSEFLDDTVDRPRMPCFPYSSEGIQELKENTDVIFVTAGRIFDEEKDKNDKRYTEKLALFTELNKLDGLDPVTDYRIIEGLPHNLDIIKNLGEWFSKGERYKGHVVIATNPTDILTYAFKQSSGLESQVSGFNHMESIRFQRNVLSPLSIIGGSGKKNGLIEARNNGVCIGDHGGGVVPVFSHLEFTNGFTFNMLDPRC
jgi:hypothetical protein